MSRRTERISSFTARFSDGRTIRINVFQDFVEHRTRGGTDVIPGRKSLVTEDGDSVNLAGPGRYKIVQTGEVLTSDDPAAPSG